MKPIHISKNIKQANTLPAAFYNDAKVYEVIKENIFGVVDGKTASLRDVRPLSLPDSVGLHIEN